MHTSVQIEVNPAHQTLISTGKGKKRKFPGVIRVRLGMLVRDGAASAFSPTFARTSMSLPGRRTRTRCSSQPVDDPESDDVGHHSWDSLPLPVTASKSRTNRRRHAVILDEPRAVELQQVGTDGSDRSTKINPGAPTSKTARIKSGLKSHWAHFRKQLGTGSALSLLDAGGNSTDSSRSIRIANTTTAMVYDGEIEDEDDREVDEVVVDSDLNASAPSEPSAPGTGKKTKSKSGTAEYQANADSLSGEHVEYGVWETYPVLTFLRWRVWPLIDTFFDVRFIDEKTEMQ